MADTATPASMRCSTRPAQQTDNARRYRLLEQAESLLNDDVAYIPLYYYATRHLVKPYVAAGTPTSWIATCRATCTCSSTRDAERAALTLSAACSRAIPTLLVIVTLAFVLLHLAPGGPFSADKAMLPEIQHGIEARYHLDEPLWRQYLRYLGDLAHGDLGPSFQYRNTSVNELIAQGFPVDLTVGLCGHRAGAAGRRSRIGLNAAWRHHPGGTACPMALAVAGISVPVFVIAPLLVLVFAMHLHWLPAGDWVAGSSRICCCRRSRWPALHRLYRAHRARQRARSAEHGLHPHRARQGPARATHPAAARACGRRSTPLVSFLGPAIAGVITGSIVVETVFGLPGIGRFFVTGALNRDYTLVTRHHHALRRPDHSLQSAGRSVLRLDRSAGATAIEALDWLRHRLSRPPRRVLDRRRPAAARSRWRA